MMNISKIKGIVLSIFLFSCLAFSSVNSTARCDTEKGTIYCLIETNSPTLIQEAIASSFEDPYAKLDISFRTGSAFATLNISLPDIITELRIVNDVLSPIFIETYVINSGVERISLVRGLIKIKQVNFFTFFPNLKVLEIDQLGSVFFPIFTQNNELTRISVETSELEDVSSRVINHTIFGGLDNLDYLKWANAGITGIKAGSFRGVRNLTELLLFGNKIQELESCTFEGLEKLESLSLSDNNISSVHPKALLGLNNLQTLDFGENPSIQLAAIRPLKKVRFIGFFMASELEDVLSEIFQQLTNLATLKLEYVNLNCSCDTEWISKLSSFGVQVSTFSSRCIDVNGEANDPSLYTHCEARSFQCFNKSIKCEGENWNRVDTVDGCECIYPEESYSASEICNDINECEDSAICQGNCTNTPGSYKCSCLEGFYNANDTHCSDINECLPTNGNCSHDCNNTIGSYECSCFPGYAKNSSTDCYLPDPCGINNGDCHHRCTDVTDGYVCTCFEGFKVSTSNSSHCIKDLIASTGAQNVNFEAYSLYILFFISFLLFITIILMFVFIVLLLLYFRRKLQHLNSTRASKTLSPTELNDQQLKDTVVIQSLNLPQLQATEGLRQEIID